VADAFFIAHLAPLNHASDSAALLYCVRQLVCQQQPTRGRVRRIAAPSEHHILPYGIGQCIHRLR
jgi:hypothetical protein